MATAWTVTAQPVLGGAACTEQDLDTGQGNYFANNGRVVLFFKGAASASGQVSVVGQRECGQGTVHNSQSAVGAVNGATKGLVLGPFDRQIYNDPSGNC